MTNQPSQLTPTLPLFIRDIKDGIVFLTDGRTCVSLILCSGVRMSVMGDKEKNAFQDTFFAAVQSIDFPISMYARSKREHYTDYINHLPTYESGWRKDAAVQYQTFVKDFAEQVNLMSKSFFIAVPHTLSRSLDTLTEEDMAWIHTEVDSKVQFVMDILGRSGIRSAQAGTEECLEISKDMTEVGTKTYELPGGTGAWLRDVLFLDRVFVAAFHLTPASKGAHVLITLEGSPDDIESSTQNLAPIYALHGIKASVVRDQVAGFLSTRPFLGTDLSVTPDSPRIDHVYPFISESFASGGIVYGVNRIVSDLVMFDRFSIGGHSISIGSHASGRTYMLKTEAQRLAHVMNTSVLVVDLFGEYESWASTLACPVIDMAQMHPEGGFFASPEKVEVYSFAKIPSPDTKIEAVNTFLETLIESISTGTQQEQCLVVVDSLSAGYTNETTLCRLAELMNLRKGTYSVAIATEDFSYFADSAVGNEILMAANMRFLFNQQTAHEMEHIAKYYGLVDPLQLKQGIGEYVLSIGQAIAVPVKNVTSYAEDVMFNPPVLPTQ